jgi:hypothetical protein
VTVAVWVTVLVTVGDWVLVKVLVVVKVGEKVGVSSGGPPPVLVMVGEGGVVWVWVIEGGGLVKVRV